MFTLYDSINVYFRAMSHPYSLSYPSPVPKLLVYLSCLLTRFATSTAFIPCQCFGSSVVPTHLPPRCLSYQIFCQVLVAPWRSVPAAFCPPGLVLTICMGFQALSKVLRCFAALLSWAHATDHVFLLVFSSSSFVGKSGREVDSLSSCISQNAFILLWHVIFTMDSMEVEFF